MAKAKTAIFDQLGVVVWVVLPDVPTTAMGTGQALKLNLMKKALDKLQF